MGTATRVFQGERCIVPRPFAFDTQACSDYGRSSRLGNRTAQRLRRHTDPSRMNQASRTLAAIRSTFLGMPDAGARRVLGDTRSEDRLVAVGVRANATFSDWLRASERWRSPAPAFQEACVVWAGQRPMDGEQSWPI